MDALGEVKWGVGVGPAYPRGRHENAIARTRDKGAFWRNARRRDVLDGDDIGAIADHVGQSKVLQGELSSTSRGVDILSAGALGDKKLRTEPEAAHGHSHLLAVSKVGGGSYCNL